MHSIQIQSSKPGKKKVVNCAEYAYCHSALNPTKFVASRDPLMIF